ncbi:hypothetical protein ACFMKD_35190, partial [Acinetobacter baumannii]
PWLPMSIVMKVLPLKLVNKLG